MSFLILDLETECHEYYGNLASPFHPENYIVAPGWALDAGDVQYEYFTKCDVPEPLRDRPINGESVYLVCTDRAFPVKLSWFPNEYSLYLLDSGLLHRERAGAALHLKALLSLTRVGV